MLKIKNLDVAIDSKPILNKISLELNPGAITALLGPNGSGKSTLGRTIAGDPKCEITNGQIMLEKTNLASLKPEDIAKLGVFLAFQNPVELDGVTVFEFLKLAYNSLQKTKNPGRQEKSSEECLKFFSEKLKFLELDEKFMERFLNQGFSGGEKKKMEILQMLLLEPKLAIIDEIDSGLDIDSLKIVAKAINELHKKGATLLIITHYRRILDYLDKIDQVIIMKDGKIAETGSANLLEKIEKSGFKEV